MRNAINIPILIFTVVFSLFLTSPAIAARPQPTPTPTPIYKVCVDAGHGGTDTGATYGTLTEAQVALDVAQRLQSLLVNAGYGVTMTRTNMSTNLGNTARANICNAAGADVLVSIHLNGSTNHTIDYTLGLYGKQTKDKAWTQKINNAMSQLSNAAGAGLIQNNGITNFADGMLLKSIMPATIAETVFISSDAEYALLNDGTGNRQQQITQQLFNGITQ